MTSFSPEPTDQPIGFGPFRLYAAARILKRNMETVSIGGRAFDILLALLKRPNDVVTKRDLFEQVWPGIHVNDGNLRIQINNLRKALGEGDGEARYIANVAGRGYCFVGTLSASVDRPASRTPSIPTAVRLPKALTKLVGRDEAIRQVCSSLLEDRFVSIVGPGGIGKTTVAAAVTRETAAMFDEVHYLDLGALTEPMLVASTLASSLGIPVNTSSPVAPLLVALNKRRSLIVFDCCEHLIDAVAELADAIHRGAEGAYILTTSRESLRSEGERVYRLRPLECPPAETTVSVNEALSYPAVQFFNERLLANGLNGHLTEETVAAVADICRRLDGIALALELAAGRVEAYGIHGTASLLDNRGEFHFKGRRGVTPRQQTLSATMDWSYNLLSEVERAVLRRMSAFVGPFSIEAANVIAVGCGVDDWQVAASIDNLVSKSLISLDPASTTTIRYRLLDTTRRYLNQRLAESGEVFEVLRKHANFYLRLLTATGSGEPASDDRLERFELITNVRAALEWSFSTPGEAGLGVALACAASYLFLEKSLLSECRIWMKKAAAEFSPHSSPTHEELEIRTSLALSLMFTEGNTSEAQTAFDRGLYLAESLGEASHQMRLLSGLQLFLARVGRFKDALVVSKQSEAVSAALPDRESSALAAAMVGTSYHLAGDQAASEAYCRAAYELPPFAGDMLFAQFGYDNRIRAFGALARVLWLRGYPTQSVAMMHDVLERARPLDPISNCISMMFTTSIAFWMEDLDLAGELVERLIFQSDKHSLHPYRMVGSGLQGKLQVLGGDRHAGMKLLTESLEALKAGRHHILALPLSADLAGMFAQVGKHEDARSTIEAITSHDEQCGRSWYTPELLRVGGAIRAVAEGPDSGAANDLLRRALDLARQQSALSWELRIATTIARNMHAIGRSGSAAVQLGSVYERFEEGHSTPDLQQAAKLLNVLKAS